MNHQHYLVSYEDGQMTSIVPVGSEACVIDSDNERNELTFFREFVPRNTQMKVTEFGFGRMASLAGKLVCSLSPGQTTP